MNAASRTIVATATIVAAALGTAACGDRSGKTLADPIFAPPATVVVTTVPASLPAEPIVTAAPLPFALVTAWVDGSEIPDRQTCAGDGVSPAITWSNVPPGAAELALTVTDLDADGFVHWIVYGIAPTDGGATEGQLPVDGFEWTNSSGSGAWAALCPPAGETHRYQFTMHALAQQLEAPEDAAAGEILIQIESTEIARTAVSGVVTSG